MAAKKKIAEKSFKKLSVQERKQYGRVLGAVMKAAYFGRGRYNVVTKDARLRSSAQVEQGGEDDALTPNERAKLLGLTRQQMRNGETLPAVLKQFEFNVVGTIGGKASFSFPEKYEESAKTMQSAFAKWASRCEFFRNENLAKLLKLTMRTMILGGDVALVFDEGAFDDSGKILGFESDNIANIPAAEFEKRMPKGWSQSQGFIYDQFHRLVGCFVAPNQRGVDTLQVFGENDELRILPLISDPHAAAEDLPFIIFANTWRFNQGRGVTPLAGSIGSTTDLEDVTKFEIQAAKWAAQKVAQIIDEGPAENKDANLGSLNPDLLTPLNEDEADEIIEAAKAELEDGQETLSLDNIEGAGALYDILPQGLKMELLSPEHPNQILPEFVKWLQGRVGWSLGVGSVYATGKADKSYTAFRGEQVMSWPAFEDLQHELETKVLDWIVPKWAKWAFRRGILPKNLALPEDWQRYVKWNWPRIREVNQVDEANAAKLSLLTYTKTYRDILGPDYKEHFKQIAKEQDELEKLGLFDPRKQTVAGGVIETDAREQKEQGEETK